MTPAPVPEWLLERIMAPPQAKQSDAQQGKASSVPIMHRIQAYLHKCDPAISGHGGHDQTFKVCCKVFDFDWNMTEESAFQFLQDHYNGKCVPPWSEGELRHKIADAKKKPRQSMDKKEEASGTKNEPAGTQPVVRCFKDIKREPVKWLWPSRIPMGKLSLIIGDPGLGKSFITIDMAARVSTGQPWPDLPTWENIPGNVINLNAEDGPEDTIAIRLDSAGANDQRIFTLDAVRDGGKERPFSLAKDLAALEKLIVQLKPRLITIDPISAYMQGIDGHRDNEVRAVLAPVAKLAHKYGVAIVGVMHLNKDSEAKAIYRGNGSIAYTAQARASWAVVKDAANPKRRLFLLVKCNLCEEEQGLAYVIQHTGDGSRLIWHEDKVDITIDQALKQLKKPGDNDADPAEFILILNYLKSSGKCGVTQIADALGIPKSTVHKYLTKLTQFGQVVGAKGKYWLPPEG